MAKRKKKSKRQLEEERKARERAERRREAALERAAELKRDQERDEQRRAEALEQAREFAAAEERTKAARDAVRARVRAQRREERRREAHVAQRSEGAREALRDLHRAQREAAEQDERRRAAAREARLEEHREERAAEQRAGEASAAGRDEQRRRQVVAERDALRREEALARQRGAARAEQREHARLGERREQQREATRAAQREQARAEQRRGEARARRHEQDQAGQRGVQAAPAGPLGLPDGPLVVRGPQILDAAGQPVILRGVTLRGLERPGALGAAFGSPLAGSDLEELQRWGATAVLLPIAQDLAMHGRGLAPAESYLQVLDDAVQRTTGAGLVAVVGLSVVSAQMPTHVDGDDRFDPALPDMESLDLWAALGRRYRSDPHVLFDLFRSPHRPWTGDATRALVERPDWSLWRRWVLAMAGAVRREHPAAIAIARGLEGGRDVSGFPLSYDDGTLVPRMVYAGELEGGQEPDSLAALAALAGRAPVCVMGWSPRAGEELQATAAGRRFAGANLHWFSSSWRSGSEALVVERRDGGLAPTPVGVATQRALAEPAQPQRKASRSSEVAAAPAVPPARDASRPGDGAKLERGRLQRTEFEGIVLTTEREQVALALEYHAATSRAGPASLGAFVDAFEREIDHRHGIGVAGLSKTIQLGLRTKPEHARDAEILSLMRLAQPQLEQEIVEIGDALDVMAGAMLDRVLTASDAVQRSERYRYELERLDEQVVGFGPHGQRVVRTRTSYSIGRNADVDSLRASAGELVTVLTELRAAVAAWRDATVPEIVERPGRVWERVPDWPERGRIEPAVLRARDAYHILRHRLEAEPPRAHAILAAFAVDAGPRDPARPQNPDRYVLAPIDAMLEQLRTIAAPADSPQAEGVAALLSGIVQSRDESVATVRTEVADSTLPAFGVEIVAELVRRAVDQRARPLLARILRDRIDAAASVVKTRERVTMALSILAAGLLLLAGWITGGVSVGLAGALVAGAAATTGVGLSLYAASRDIEDYMLKKALTGTDFDKAKALSQEEPSVFWLAVSVAGTVFDVFDALKVVRVLAPTAKAAVALRRGNTALPPDYLELLEQRARRELRGLGISGERSDALLKGLREGAEREALAQRSTLTEFAERWRAGLNEETRTLLLDQQLWTQYRTMDPTVREVLTLCQSMCVPPLAISEKQLKALTIIINRANARQRIALRRGLAKHRSNLDPPIAALEGAIDRGWAFEVDDFVEAVFREFDARGPLATAEDFIQIGKRGAPEIVADIGRRGVKRGGIVRGQFVSLKLVKRSQKLLGRRIVDAPPTVRNLWNDVRSAYIKRVKPRSNAEWLAAYESIRESFWRAVRHEDNAGAKAWFEQAGFIFDQGGPTSAPLFVAILEGGRRTEFRLTLDHIVPKALKPRKATDADNLQFVMHWDNWLMNELQRIPGLARQ